MTVPTPPGSAASRDGAVRDREPGLAVTLTLYTLARLGILAIVTALLVLAGVPFVLAALIALIVALPLSMVLFRGLRSRLDRALAVRGARRREQRDSLRAELRGEGGDGGDGGDGGERAGPPAGSEPERPADGQPDAGGDRPGQQ